MPILLIKYGLCNRTIELRCLFNFFDHKSAFIDFISENHYLKTPSEVCYTSDIANRRNSVITSSLVPPEIAIHLPVEVKGQAGVQRTCGRSRRRLMRKR